MFHVEYSEEKSDVFNVSNQVAFQIALAMNSIRRLQFLFEILSYSIGLRGMRILCRRVVTVEHRTKKCQI